MEEGGERGQREAEGTTTARMEEARVEELHSQEEGQPEKRPRIERSDTETEAVGGEAGQ